uniref:Uncharacterized protein n=1 Tax=Pristionchus pacificus TaxID=54126 RepID=A0A2A6BEV5_PRIPA|eukprot:PDM64430.1 hypothetical protein PRIPAC_52686 [Pristionchus pacificus]
MELQQLQESQESQVQQMLQGRIVSEEEREWELMEGEKAIVSLTSLFLFSPPSLPNAASKPGIRIGVPSVY